MYSMVMILVVLSVLGFQDKKSIDLRQKLSVWRGSECTNET